MQSPEATPTTTAKLFERFWKASPARAAKLFSPMLQPLWSPPGDAADFPGGVQVAAKSIDSGAARAVVDALIQFSREEKQTDRISDLGFFPHCCCKFRTAITNETNENAAKSAVSHTICPGAPIPSVQNRRKSTCQVMGFSNAATRNQPGSGSSG